MLLLFSMMPELFEDPIMVEYTSVPYYMPIIEVFIFSQLLWIYCFVNVIKLQFLYTILIRKLCIKIVYQKVVFDTQFLYTIFGKMFYLISPITLSIAKPSIILTF